MPICFIDIFGGDGGNFTARLSGSTLKPLGFNALHTAGRLPPRETSVSQPL